MGHLNEEAALEIATNSESNLKYDKILEDDTHEQRIIKLPS